MALSEIYWNIFFYSKLGNLQHNIINFRKKHTSEPKHKYNYKATYIYPTRGLQLPVSSSYKTSFDKLCNVIIFIFVKKNHS